MRYEDFIIGRQHNEKVLITQEAVNSFAAVTGDNNPLHTDPEFASRSIFGKPIAHGMFGLGLISAALGMRFPGFGTIYMGQEAKFFNPIFIGEEVQVMLQISELQPEKKRLILSTQVIKENGEIAIDGFARVQFNPDLFAQSG